MIVAGRDHDALAAAYAGYGERVLAVQMDVASESSVQHAVDTALAHFGRIDVLVNNAGYGQLGLFEELVADDIQRQFDTNVFGTMHVSRAVLPAMRRQRSGHLFNLSSMGGVVGFAGAAVYCASKFAIEGFSESLAPEVAPFGIRVTLVEPGFIRTDFLDSRSVRYGSKAIDDDAQISAQARALYEQNNHAQPGDPARLAAALLQLADAAEPPLRYAGGSDAVTGITAKLETMESEIERWRELSVSVDGAY